MDNKVHTTALSWLDTQEARRSASVAATANRLERLNVHVVSPWLTSLVVSARTCLLISGAWYVDAGASPGLVAALILEEGQ